MTDTPDISQLRVSVRQAHPWDRRHTCANSQHMIELADECTCNIATDTGDTWDAEIKLVHTVAQSGAIQERHNERSKTAIDVHPDLRPLRQSGKVRDWVLGISLPLRSFSYGTHDDTVREIRS